MSFLDVFRRPKPETDPAKQPLVYENPLARLRHEAATTTYSGAPAWLTTAAGVAGGGSLGAALGSLFARRVGGLGTAAGGALGALGGGLWGYHKGSTPPVPVEKSAAGVLDIGRGALGWFGRGAATAAPTMKGLARPAMGAVGGALAGSQIDPTNSGAGAALGAATGALGFAPRNFTRGFLPGAVRTKLPGIVQPAIMGGFAGGTADMGLGMMGVDTHGAFATMGTLGAPAMRAMRMRASMLPGPMAAGFKPSLGQHARAAYNGVQDFANAPWTAMQGLGKAWSKLPGSAGTKAGVGLTAAGLGIGVPRMMYQSARNQAVEDADVYLKSRLPQAAEYVGQKALHGAGHAFNSMFSGPADAALQFAGIDPQTINPYARGAAGALGAVGLGGAAGVPWWLAAGAAPAVSAYRGNAF